MAQQTKHAENPMTRKTCPNGHPLTMVPRRRSGPPHFRGDPYVLCAGPEAWQSVYDDITDALALSLAARPSAAWSESDAALVPGGAALWGVAATCETSWGGDPKEIGHVDGCDCEGRDDAA